MDTVRAECLYTIENTLILLKLVCYKFKMLLVIPKVMTKKTTKNIQKRKEGNQSGTLLKSIKFFKSQQIQKGKIKQQRQKKNRQLNDRSKSFLTFFFYKCIKLSIKRQKLTYWILKHHLAMCCLQEIHFRYKDAKMLK